MNGDNYDQLNDQQLLENFYATGKNELLGALLQRYTILLLGVCMKYLKNEEDAKDAVQQVFYKALNELKKYKVDYFKSWLYMVAKNHCLMQLRNKYSVVSIQVKEELTKEETLNVLSPVEKEQVYGLLESSLEELPAQQKTCITLFYLQKQSYQQISETTGFNLMNVKSYIQNGKRNLKLLVQKKMKVNE